MARPSLIRADTIDLQDHEAPSAKDHTNQDNAHVGSHQAETLREVAHETAVDEARSPRVSWSNGDPLAGGGGIGGDIDMTAANGKLQQQQQQQQQRENDDPLAVAQNGGLSSSDEGDLDGDGEDLDDDMMDRISSSPSIEDECLLGPEDIDFEFVYALHTFVATVEGQANAIKGDTMVLLDDSNSYWWLVRVVKDSSIGYLPAEHIETPTERLARLNKHRNVDLSATMLGDQAPKPKSSFTKMRRKKKNVAFTEPTYVDYSDFAEDSSDEEDIEELFGKGAANAALQQQQQKQQGQQATETAGIKEVNDEGAKVAPLKTRTSQETARTETTREETATLDEEEETRVSEEIWDTRPDGLRKTRNGTIRNTDSFFKDNTAETKKMTLTPNLLRDDNESRPSTDSNQDLKARASLDKMDKELMSDKDKKKQKDKDKREKDKKPSAIRSFFSRKDKKKNSEDDDESFGKRSMDVHSEPRDSEDYILEEQSPERSASQRQASKLQKPQPRSESSLKNGPGTVELSTYLAESRVNNVSNNPPTSMRIVGTETEASRDGSSGPSGPTRSASASGVRDYHSPSASGVEPRSASAALEQRPYRANAARSRMELDESDIEEVDEMDVAPPTKTTPGAMQQPGITVAEENAPEETRNVYERSAEATSRPHLPGAFPDSFQTAQTSTSEQTVKYLGEDDPEEPVSPVSSNPPALEDPIHGGVSPDQSPSPEPDTRDYAQEGSPQQDPQESPKEQPWDDEKLRAFFDESDHVRDLLALVYNKTDAVPAGADHPVVGPLFREQNAKLAEITTQLDNMLGDWLARKQRMRGTV